MLNAFVNLNKVKGMTSQQAVSKIKRILREKGIPFGKVGHMGTLDPDGEGVLPIAIGRATRLFNYFLDKKKIYYTEFTFGKTTDTLDESGKVIEESTIIPTKEDIISAIPSLIGKVSQLPPAYSAKVINGQRAYKLARMGEKFELKPKLVDIYDITLLEKLDNNNTFSFRVTCGGGTYIRSLARDMATLVGSVGLMRYIRRLESGGFSIEESQTFEEFEKNPTFIDLEKVCSIFPRYDAPPALKKLILDGVKVTLDDTPKGDFCLYLDNSLVGIAFSDEKKRLIIKTRLI